MPIYTNTNPYQPNGYTPIQYGTGNGVQGNTFMTNFPYQPNGYTTVVGSGTGPDNPFFNTFPYQDNGYAPIQVGTGIGPIHNQYFNFFHYQHNGPFPIQYGQGIGPDNPFFNTFPYTVDTTQVGSGIGPANPFYNTFPYQDNGYAPITYGIGEGSGFSQMQLTQGTAGPNNTFYESNPFSEDGDPYPEVGTMEYPDWTAKVKEEPYNFNPNLIPSYRVPTENAYTADYPNAGTFYNFNSKDGIANSENFLTLETLEQQGKIALASGITSNTAIVGLATGVDKRSSNYKLLDKKGIEKISKSFLPYYDYRREIGDLGVDTRLDGTSAIIRTSAVAAGYLAASLLPGGAYSVFNLQSTYGFGSYTGFNAAAKKDFTVRSNAVTRWKKGSGDTPGGFIQTNNPLDLINQFRGDKVNIIDFGNKSYSQIYKWRPPLTLKESAFGDFLDGLGVGHTRDLIKFYFTGPKLTANPKNKLTDDVLVFRAIITSMTDSFTGAWNPVTYIGRADPTYTYQGYGRQFDVGFTVYASSRDELQPMYRKLNYLASYTAPSYTDDTLTMEAPWLRITIGDLLVHQPVVLNLVNYTFVDGDTSWETNLVKDPTMMQVPFKVEVSLQFNVITDYLPQKGGQMYTLATKFDSEGQPVEGNRSWLSDAKRSTIKADVEENDNAFSNLFKRTKTAFTDLADSIKKKGTDG